MAGTAPTTGKDGIASQAKMMAQMEAALSALDGADDLKKDGAMKMAQAFSVIFEAKEPIVMERTPEQIAAEFTARENAVKAREEAAAARVRTQFEASNGRAIDDLVRAGKVLPADADGLKLAFNALDPEAEELTFGAGDKTSKATAVSHILTFMADKLGKVVPTGERQSPATEFDAKDVPDGLSFNARVDKLVEGGMSLDSANAHVAALMGQ